MRDWLSAEYRAVIYEKAEEVVAYALFREQPQEIYLRQLFVVRDKRRRGIGRKAVQILRSKVWPRNKRLTVDVLVTNQSAIAWLYWLKTRNTVIAMPTESTPIASPRSADRLTCSECPAALTRKPGAANTGASRAKFNNASPVICISKSTPMIRLTPFTVDQLPHRTKGILLLG